MDSFNIRRYEDGDFKQVVSLLVDSFESKFSKRQNLRSEEIQDIISKSWNLKEDSLEHMHFVASIDEKIIGVILIRYGRDGTDDSNIPFKYLIKKYGFKNILLIFFKMYLLEFNAGNNCYVEHIAVDKDFRGKGVGLTLLKHSEEELLNYGYASLSLIVAEDNPAKNLYSRLGFKTIKKIRSPFKKIFIGVSKWYLMKKDLSLEK